MNLGAASQKNADSEHWVGQKSFLAKYMDILILNACVDGLMDIDSHIVTCKAHRQFSEPSFAN